METTIIPFNKEQYTLRKISNEISITNKLLFDIVEKEPKEYFDKGEYHIEKFEFKEALNWFSLAIQAKPNYALAYCSRGFTNLFLGEYSDSISDFDKSIDIKPNNHDAFFGRAQVKINLQDAEGAIGDLTSAIKLESKDGYAYFYRAKIKQDTGNIKGAIEDAAKAGQNGYKKAAEIFEESLPKFLEENYTAYCAIENLSEAIQGDRRNAELYYKRAIEKFKLNDYANAIEDFKTNIHLKGADLKTYSNISMALFFLGNAKYNSKDFESANKIYHESVSYCNKVIDLNQNFAEAYLIRGSVKRMLGERNGALNDLKKAGELGDQRAEGRIKEMNSENENIANGFFQDGNSNYSKQKYNEALALYTKAINIQPNNSKYLYQIGITKLFLKDYNGAIADLSKSIDLDPSFDFSFFNRGDAKFDLQDFPGAIQDYSSAIERNPRFESAFLNRGLAKQSLNNHAEAIQDFSKVIELNPKNFLAFRSRGISKRHLNDDTGAIVDFDFVIHNEPTNANAYFDRGATKLALSQFEAARKDLLRAGELGYVRAYEIINQYLRCIS